MYSHVKKPPGNERCERLHGCYALYHDMYVCICETNINPSYMWNQY